MSDFDPRALPFVNKEMLNFPAGTQYQLLVTYQAASNHTFSVIGATRNGTFKYDIPTDINSYNVPQYFGLTDIPLWISVVDGSGNYLIGDLFVQVDLVVNGDIVISLCAGYVNYYERVSWPQQNIPRQRDYSGRIATVTGTDPAANVEIDYNHSPVTDFHVHSVRFTLVTDANVANRQVVLSYKPGNGTATLNIAAPSVQPASQTYNYNFIKGIGAFQAVLGNEIICPLPDDYILTNADHVVTVTTNKQVTDNYGAPLIRGRITMGVI